ncbi:DUF72 domain-containing protein [Jeotgalibacillus soli]|uniref:DUF72 domain-containing protein n=1 Tax=Jeotgalibacillus soli TaxID=889306 RepID=A0A0C2V0Q5_9BACL|nr:DUF72 domain-containing protein [Jeotgalibacillus soli]KIL42647.1 hypothetical protein KP78_38700 [Jeotgalibacillus soli]
MIYIGLTGWGDHPSLYMPASAGRDKLKDYGSHFPVVELDASFYAVQPVRHAEKWVNETPSSFKFVIKAYQGITGHQRGDIPFDSKEVMFKAFRASLQPFIDEGKLAMVLLQFPPWFNCTKAHVDYLRYCQHMLSDVPISLEFRNQTWYSPIFRKKTISFMEHGQWIHSVCDEPQAGEGSIPIVPVSTNTKATLIRFHGRNMHGWTRKGNGDNWREVRYLYKYNEQELSEWVGIIRELQQQSKDLYILFNNNSGGDAAHNAKQLMQLLGIEYEDLAPRQLDLF